MSVPEIAAPDDRWLSLGPASRLLGVDPDTLRRWADAGRVETWTTPGGHRRFDRRSLERLAVDRRGARSSSLATLGTTPERVNRAYRRRYQADAALARPSATAPDDAEREAYRREGRRLVTTLIAYLDATADDGSGASGGGSDARAVIEAEATAIVDEHGRRFAASGASLTEAVSRFVAARQPFLAELAGLGRRRSLDPGHLGVLYEDASMLLDRLLLRFIAAYQAEG